MRDVKFYIVLFLDYICIFLVSTSYSSSEIFKMNSLFKFSFILFIGRISTFNKIHLN